MSIQAQSKISPITAELSACIAATLRKPLPKAVAEKTRHHILDTIAAMVSDSKLAPDKAALANAMMALPAEQLHATTSLRSGNTRRRASNWLRAGTPHPMKPIGTLSARASFCTAMAVIAAGRFAKFHAAIKASVNRGDLPPHSSSISGGLDATPPGDAK